MWSIFLCIGKKIKTNALEVNNSLEIHQHTVKTHTGRKTADGTKYESLFVTDEYSISRGLCHEIWLYKSASIGPRRGVFDVELEYEGCWLIHDEMYSPWMRSQESNKDSSIHRICSSARRIHKAKEGQEREDCPDQNSNTLEGGYFATKMLLL